MSKKTKNKHDTKTGVQNHMNTKPQTQAGSNESMSTTHKTEGGKHCGSSCK